MEEEREKALQTVVQGQQAENLLDFDADDTMTNGDSSSSSFTNRPQNDSGLISSRQIKTAAKAANPLDELMDLFSTASMQAPTQSVGQPASAMSGMGGMGGMSGMDLMSPPSSSPVSAQMGSMQGNSGMPRPQQQQQSQQQGGQQKKEEDDLLGLF